MNVIKQYPVHEYTVNLQTKSVSFCKTEVTAETDEQGDVLHTKRLWRAAVTASAPDRDAMLTEHFDPATAAFLTNVLTAAAASQPTEEEA